MSNLAYGGGKFKELMRAKMEGVAEKLRKVLSAVEYKGPSVTLTLMVIALVANLCTDSKIREYVASNPYDILTYLVSQIATMFEKKPAAYFVS